MTPWLVAIISIWRPRKHLGKLLSQYRTGMGKNIRIVFYAFVVEFTLVDQVIEKLLCCVMLPKSIIAERILSCVR